MEVVGGSSVQPGGVEASIMVRRAGEDGDSKKGVGSVRHLSAVVRRELKQAGHSKEAVSRLVLPKEGLKKLTAMEWSAATHPLVFRQLEKSRRAMQRFFGEVCRASEELESVHDHWREFLGRDLVSDRERSHQSAEQLHAQAMNQYFTSTANAVALMSWLQSCLPAGLWAEAWFVEPAAGAGDIYELLPPERRVGVELDPELCREASSSKGWNFVEGDFLAQTRKSLGLEWVDPSSTIVVGNPPYVARKEGRVVPDRSLLLSFIYQSLLVADHVGLLLPKQCHSEAFQVEVKAGWDAYQDEHGEANARPMHMPVGDSLEVVSVPAADDGFTFCGQKVRRKSTFQLWQRVRAGAPG